ncbi:MAG: glycosyltransferase family 39 protein [Proteobacteria bacterium]|nr:glycosyltransferase family 39 protein [Pseudomonadota bacterium]
MKSAVLQSESAAASSPDRRIVFIIFALSALFQLLAFWVMPISITQDSPGYMAFASELFSPPAGSQRTAGYPFLIAASGVRLFDSLIPLIFIQGIMSTLVPVLAYLTLSPAGRAYGIIAALLSLIFMHQYVMSLQVMTDAPFIFSVALVAFLISRYFRTENLLLLILTLFAIALFGLIRPSTDVLFGGVLLGLCFLAVQSRRRKIVSHLIIAALVVSTIWFGRGLLTDRTAANLGPFFMWHWVYADPEDYGLVVSLENGPRTRELFATLGEVLKKDRAAYDWLASDRDQFAAPVSVKDKLKHYDVDVLLDDLVENPNKHNGPAMAFILWNHVGKGKTASLLRGAIIESLAARPDVIWTRLKQIGSALITDVPRFRPERNTMQWMFIPAPGEEGLFLHHVVGGKGVGPGVFAEWVFGLDRQSGEDEGGKEHIGRYPESWQEARAVFVDAGNFAALGNFIWQKASRISARFVWGLVMISVVFALWSSQKPLYVAVLVAGVASSVLGTFIGDFWDARTMFMAYPLLVVAAVLGMEGAARLAAGTGVWRFMRKVYAPFAGRY